MNKIVCHYLNLPLNTYLLSFSILAGFPTTTTSSGNDLFTTDPIPTNTFSPITIPFFIVAFVVRNVSNNVKIGNYVKIQNNVSLYEGAELEDYVFCGPSMVFTNDLTPRSKYPKGPAGYKKTLVREGATIGANATIVCGNIIGKNSMIAAGSVVSKDVPDHALMAGVPARQVGWVCECGQKLNGDLVCEHCSRKYEKSEDGLRPVL
jgi:UDP-2-acetamido-3-amino-2,3-dideoxy-glucuronate N-acetyltransferase